MTKRKKKPAKRGPKSTYDPKVHPKEVVKLCELGATDQEIADIWGIDVATFYRWKASFPELCEAVTEAKEVADRRVVRSLYHRALGYSHPDTDIRVIRGKVVQTEIRKHYPPDAASMIFWLKNRNPENWRDRIGFDGKVEVEVTWNRDANAYPGRVIEHDANTSPELLELLRGHAPEVQARLAQVLAGVPTERLREVYDRAVGAVLDAAQRSDREQPSAASGLLERQATRPDVAPAGPGFMANLDEESEAQQKSLQDAQADVEAHNRRVRERAKKRRKS